MISKLREVFKTKVGPEADKLPTGEFKSVRVTEFATFCDRPCELNSEARRIDFKLVYAPNFK